MLVCWYINIYIIFRYIRCEGAICMSTCFINGSRWLSNGPLKNAEQFLWPNRNVALLGVCLNRTRQLSYVAYFG